jgi:PTH1 family peptidyl-tRNA hydrolase
VRIGIGHPGHKDRVNGHVLGNYAKVELDPLADLLGAIAAEAAWLAKGDEVRFMNDVALRMQPDDG